jgi:serine/threonine protein kinase
MSEREIFLAALVLDDPQARGSFLDQACAGSPALRAKVEALLKSHEQAGSFLHEPATADMEEIVLATSRDKQTIGGVPDQDGADGGEPIATLPADGSEATRLQESCQSTQTTESRVPHAQRDSRVGSAVDQVIAGRYALLDELGEGGMGTVYLAEQTAPVRRQVALKLIKVGMDSRAVLARFEAERQALALMDHPNIARVYDGGTTQAGQPFFVMELVRGVPITDYCDQQRLPVRARLELFVSVCQAVQHAHQKGIIHRDLKPSNVMVTEVDGRPTPKVIDFGVAKAMQFKLTDQSLGDTGAIVGTPTYMSPEQADPSSMDIDTRTDVYALGVILYELLAGSPPIDAKQFKRGAILEILRMVREVEPPRPSTKVSTSDALPTIAAQRQMTPFNLTRLMRGELDWIIMKALEKDRNRRYETANSFGIDIQRYLTGEPLLAGPPSATYRLRIFLRRNQGPVLAAAAVVLALAAGLAVSTWQAIRATQAQHVASVARDAAEVARDAERVERKAAEHERIRAEAERARADEKELTARRYLYGARISLAHLAWEEGKVGRMLEILDTERPKPGQQDLRSFEWYYLWRLCHGLQLTLPGHAEFLSCVAFSPDGKTLASSDGGGTVKLWDVATARELATYKCHGAVSCVLFSPDGNKIATAGGTLTQGTDKGEAKLWDVTTGRELKNFRGDPKYWVYSLAFSPDGKLLATGSAEPGRTPNAGEVKLWDVTTGDERITLSGHKYGVSSLSFSPDGKKLATGGGLFIASNGDEGRYDPGEIIVWDTVTGQQLVDLRQ